MTVRRRLGPPGPWIRALAGPILLTILASTLDVDAIAARLRGLDPGWMLGAVGATAAYTALSAWRWRYTSRRLGLDLEFRHALGEYYASILLNQILPGGVLGDAARAARHARSTPTRWARGTAIRAVVLERASAQAVMTLVGISAAAAYLWRPAGGLVTGAGLLLACAGLLMWTRSTRKTAQPGAAWVQKWSGDARTGILGWPASGVHFITATSVVGLYVLTYLFAARAVGVETPFTVLAPLVPPVLLTMLIPVSIAGWGVREGAAAAFWSVAGLGATDGVSISVAYGVLVLVGSLPGALVLASTGLDGLRSSRPVSAAKIEVEENVLTE